MLCIIHKVELEGFHIEAKGAFTKITPYYVFIGVEGNVKRGNLDNLVSRPREMNDKVSNYQSNGTIISVVLEVAACL